MKNLIQRISDSKYLGINNTWVDSIEEAIELTIKQCQQAKETYGKYKVRIIAINKNKDEYTTSELIALQNPILGKLYFNTEVNALCFYDGENWKKTTSDNL